MIAIYANGIVGDPMTINSHRADEIAAWIDGNCDGTTYAIYPEYWQAWNMPLMSGGTRQRLNRMPPRIMILFADQDEVLFKLMFAGRFYRLEGDGRPTSNWMAIEPHLPLRFGAKVYS